jgi:SAM-dependent methyltransferase
MKIFTSYARYYDALYKDRNYEKEADFVDRMIKKYSNVPVKSILSLGCGTCNHDLALTKKGYTLIGVDASKDMLGLAKEKIRKVKEKHITLIHSDIRKPFLSIQADCSMAMFNVMGYQITDDDIKRVLQNVHASIVKKGIFMFDCWFLPAVIADNPKERIKEVQFGSDRIIRITKPRLDELTNTISIHFHLLHIQGKRIVQELEETHVMRYFTVLELQRFLCDNGFVLKKMGAFMDIETQVSSKRWDMFVVAEKK